MEITLLITIQLFDQKFILFLAKNKAKSTCVISQSVFSVEADTTKVLCIKNYLPIRFHILVRK